MKPIPRLRRIIDREWIRVGWSGHLTWKHRLIMAAPFTLVGGAAILVEPLSRTAAVIVVFTGFCLTGALGLWISCRAMAGTGSFSSRRSERFVRRERARKAKREQEKFGDRVR